MDELPERYEKVAVLGRGSFGTAILVRPLTGSAASLASAMSPQTSCSSNGSGQGAIVGGSSSSTLRVVKEVELDSINQKQRTEALREAEVLKSLSHPNIVGYLDALLIGSRLEIVMEYADGGDLAAQITRRRTAGKRFHEREAMALFAQVALALEYVHGHRILHRDLKSQNIFLTSAGVAKLGDFGISRVLLASEVCAETVIGTPQNLPPELCENRPYDFKADVWGLGILLYEMLALEVPFNASSFAALVLKICTAEPRPVPAVYGNEVRQLLARLLAKKPEDRPSSAEVAAVPHVRRGLLAAGAIAHVSTPPSSSRCNEIIDRKDQRAATAIDGSRGQVVSAEAGRCGAMIVNCTPRRLKLPPEPLSSASLGSAALQLGVDAPLSNSPKRGRAVSLSAESGDDVRARHLDSPKKARLRLLVPMKEALAKTPPGAQAANVEEWSPKLPSGSHKVSNTDLVEVGLRGCPDWDLNVEISPLKNLRAWRTTCSPSPHPIEASLMNSQSPELEISGTWSTLLKEFDLG